MRVDEARLGKYALELGPHLVDVHIHRAVAGAQRVIPHDGRELLARHDPRSPTGQRQQDPVFAHAEVQRPPVREDERVVGADLELARTYDLIAPCCFHRGAQRRASGWVAPLRTSETDVKAW